jgi:hypothetical protein
VDNSASIFRVEVFKVFSFCVYKESTGGNRRVGTGASSEPTRILGWEKCIAGHFKGPGLHQKNPPASDVP